MRFGQLNKKQIKTSYEVQFLINLMLNDKIEKIT
jgi:hypothetical protein